LPGASSATGEPRITLPAALLANASPGSDSSAPVKAPLKADSTEAPVLARVAPTDPAKAAPLPNMATPPEPTPAKPAVKGSAQIQEYINKLRITGIRAAGTESKVLMNDRVYKVNDMVDRAIGLKLTAVAADRLTFVDENGVEYIRNF
jgi:hypothetical protein